MENKDEGNSNNPVGSLIANGLMMSSNGNDDDGQQQNGAGEEESYPKPTSNEVLQCQLSSWYEKFSSISDRPRKNVTIKSIILDGLPTDFKEYLLSDGVRLPLNATTLSSFAPPESPADDDWSSDGDDNNNNNDDEVSECSEPPKQFHFPDLNQRITSAIETLKGSVIPKLNWSSPRDAVWVNGGSLKCTTAGDVYLLVKSSDFCLHDVQMHALEECTGNDDIGGDDNDDDGPKPQTPNPKPQTPNPKPHQN